MGKGLPVEKLIEPRVKKDSAIFDKKNIGSKRSLFIEQNRTQTGSYLEILNFFDDEKIKKKVFLGAC